MQEGQRRPTKVVSQNLSAGNINVAQTQENLEKLLQQQKLNQNQINFLTRKSNISSKLFENEDM